jgi:hypothetical protein
MSSEGIEKRYRPFGSRKQISVNLFEKIGLPFPSFPEDDAAKRCSVAGHQSSQPYRLPTRVPVAEIHWAQSLCLSAKRGKNR